MNRDLLLLHHGGEVHFLYREAFPDPSFGAPRAFGWLHRVLRFSPGVTQPRVE